MKLTEFQYPDDDQEIILANTINERCLFDYEIASLRRYRELKCDMMIREIDRTLANELKRRLANNG